MNVYSSTVLDLLQPSSERRALKNKHTRKLVDKCIRKPLTEKKQIILHTVNR